MKTSVVRLTVAALLAGMPAASLIGTAQNTARLAVAAVSTRADMVTGGDVLIRLSGSNSPDLQATVAGKPVTVSHVRSANGGVEALVSGLPLGKSTVSIRSSGATGSLDVVNYPITGPVFSGPHQTPHVCQTEAWKLGAALDADCSVKTRTEWQYKSTAPVTGRGQSAFKPLSDPKSRPADLAEATVNGVKVPYIVRLETGTINRAVYQIAMIDAAWNRRLIYTFGGSCMAGYVQGTSSGGVMNDLHLSQGYAVASSSLNVFGNNCNGVLSAETLMMVKEHFIETYGVPKHTIGWGGSGGAMAQYEIAQNYPGLLDGILPTMTFPDATTYFIESEDCRLLLRPYLNKTNLTEEQKRAITGMSTWATCDNSYANRPGRLNPTDCDADLPKELRYDPVTNPKGARCSIYDGMANIFGKDGKTGFARRPNDNIGVQYGLAALNDGTITKDVFLDLNEKVGGYDIDAKWQPARIAGDAEAIGIAYASGQTVTGAGGLATVPIIDARPYLDLEGNFHESYHSFRVRARLVKTNGNADNQVILRAPNGAVYTKVQAEFLAQMDKWLDAIEADTSKIATHEKIVRAKPADLVDACWDKDGKRIADPAVYGKASPCNELFPPHSAPRLVAGAPLQDDIWKCQLKPVDYKDYKVAFTDAEKARMKQIFASGVCDWAKPSQYQTPLKGTWQRY
jgi:hypothetical protein